METPTTAKFRLINLCFKSIAYLQMINDTVMEEVSLQYKARSPRVQHSLHIHFREISSVALHTKDTEVQDKVSGFIHHRHNLKKQGLLR